VADAHVRSRRDTGQDPPTISSEAAVLRSMARTERQLELVAESLRDLHSTVVYQGRVFYRAALTASMVILVIGSALVVAAAAR
jgi:hypothetical protein